MGKSIWQKKEINNNNKKKRNSRYILWKQVIIFYSMLLFKQMYSVIRIFRYFTRKQGRIIDFLFLFCSVDFEQCLYFLYVIMYAQIVFTKFFLYTKDLDALVLVNNPLMNFITILQKSNKHTFCIWQLEV